MIELLSDMPAGVVGFRVSGHLTGDELRDLRPAVEDLVKAGEVRIVEVVASDYAGFGPGGLTEDVKLGFGAVLTHPGSFKKIAFVTDKEWAVHLLHAIAWMIPGEFKTFGLDELDEAKRWAAD